MSLTISPNIGPVTGGQTITISSVSSFVGCSITFGSSGIVPFIIDPIIPTKCTLVVPATSSPLNVTVIQSLGIADLANGTYQYYGQSFDIVLNPSSGPINVFGTTTVATNLPSDPTPDPTILTLEVMFNNINMTVFSSYDPILKTVTITIPPNSVVGPVLVEIFFWNGTHYLDPTVPLSSYGTGTFNYIPSLFITSDLAFPSAVVLIWPAFSDSSVGASATFSFSDGTPTVTVPGTSAGIISMTCVLPLPNTGNALVTVYVTSASNMNTATQTFSYISMTPNQGLISGGTNVIFPLSGTYDSTTQVFFGTVLEMLIITGTSPNFIYSAISPPGSAGPISVSIQTSNGSLIAIGKFTYLIPCLAPTTKILLPDGQSKEIQDLRRGDYVAGDFNCQTLFRISQVNILPFTIEDTAGLVELSAGSLGENMPSDTLRMTNYHPICYQGARYEAQCFSDFPGVNFYNNGNVLDVMGRCNDGSMALYDLQFDFDAQYIAEGVAVQSRSPFYRHTPLPKDLYFDQSLYQEVRVDGTVNHPLPFKGWGNFRL